MRRRRSTSPTQRTRRPEQTCISTPSVHLSRCFAEPLPQAGCLCLQVNRQNLDFDFEKLCSVSLSNINVYCCLVDGKYFQGRGKNSWAYKHSVGEGHHVFLKLDTEEVGPLRMHVARVALVADISPGHPLFSSTFSPTATKSRTLLSPTSAESSTPASRSSRSAGCRTSPPPPTTSRTDRTSPATSASTTSKPTTT